MKTLLSITVVLLFANCFAQTRHQKLIAAEYRIDSPGIGNFTYLVLYNFANGRLLSKDTLLAVPTSKKGIGGSYVRYDLGKNFIYKNRYVISGIGNVIDLKTRSLVTEESDDFISAQGDNLIFHRNNVVTGTGYLMLDLGKRKYGFINQDKIDKDRDRKSSPDKQHFLSIDQREIPYKIWLHNSEGEKRIVVNNAGHGPNIMHSGPFHTLKLIGLTTILFFMMYMKSNLTAGPDDYVKDTLFGSNSKKCSSVTIRKYNIGTGSDSVFFVLDSVGNGQTNGNFFTYNIGQLIYSSSGRTYHLVDTANNILSDYPYYEMGFGFSEQIRLTKKVEF